MAVALLRERMSEAAEGQLPVASRRAVRMRDLFEALKTDQVARELRSAKKAQQMIDKHLMGPFGDLRADRVTDQTVADFIIRTRPTMALGTLVLVLGYLRRTLRLAAKRHLLRVDRLPTIPEFNPHNARQGFVEPADFAELEAAIRRRDEDLADAVRFKYLTAWRKQEVLGLQWSELVTDADGNPAIRLPPARTKTSEVRLLPLIGELATIVERRAALRHPDCAFVFHRHGRPIRSPYYVWHAARAEIGMPTLVINDLRRSGIRNMTRAGVPEQVAMTISGHESPTVFRRYNITSNADRAAAMSRVSAALASALQQSLPFGKSRVVVLAPFARRKRRAAHE